MKVEFELCEKSFASDNGNTIKYYVLKRELVDGSIIEVPIKSDKYKLLSMSLKLEK